MIQVSETAKQRVIGLMTEDGYDASKDYVRVGVKSGGCSGLSYELKFDKTVEDTDKVFEDNGVRIIIDKKSFLYLAGTILEYSGGLNGKGFVFNNPNAQRTCGCGESFSLWFNDRVINQLLNFQIGKSKEIWHIPKRN